MKHQNLLHVLYETARRIPDRPAFKVLSEADMYVATTYGELLERVRAIGTGLMAELAPAKGEPIGLLSDNRLEWILADLAIVGSGAVDVPRGTDTVEEELAQILAHAGCRVVFVEDARQLEKIEAIAERLEGYRGAVVLDPAFRERRDGAIPFAELEAKGRALLATGDRRFDEAAIELTSDDLVTIIYTSGTTGRPKGVELTHGNILHQIETLPAHVQTDENDRWVSVLPPWHVFERTVEYGVIAQGASMAYSKPVRQILLRSLELEKPTVIAVVPRVLDGIHDSVLRNVRKDGAVKEALFRFFLEVGRRSFRAEVTLEGRDPDLAIPTLPWELARRARAAAELAALSPLRRLADTMVFSKIRAKTGGALKRIISGGAPLPAHLDEFFAAIGIPVLEGYGLTETAPVVCVRAPGRSAPFTVGHPLAGTEVETVDERGRRVGPSEPGRVRVRGPQVMRGYHRDEAATRAVLSADGWFDTGDLGMRLPGGEIKLTGRAKDLIVLATGEKVEPEPLEIRLKRSPFMGQVLVTGQDQHQLCALIVPNFEMLREKLGKAADGVANEDIVERPEVRALFRHELLRLLPDGATRPQERVRRFKLLAKDFKVGEELTPTLKMKRDVIRRRYQEAIAAAT